MSRIIFQDVTLSANIKGRMVCILENENIEIPSGAFGVISGNNYETQLFVGLLSQRYLPQKGRVLCPGDASWPLGHATAFSLAVNMSQNLRHLCNLYNKDFYRIHKEMTDIFGIEYMECSLNKLTRGQIDVGGAAIAALMCMDVYIIDGQIVDIQDEKISLYVIDKLFNSIRNGHMFITERQLRIMKAISRNYIAIKGGKIYIYGNYEEAKRFVGDGEGSDNDIDLGGPALQEDDMSNSVI